MKVLRPTDQRHRQNRQGIDSFILFLFLRMFNLLFVPIFYVSKVDPTYCVKTTVVSEDARLYGVHVR